MPKESLQERLLALPHVKQALLDHGAENLDVSAEMADWVIRECFDQNRRLQFVEEADETLALCKGLFDYNSVRQEIVDKFATTAAAAYLLGAFAGACGVIEASTEPTR